MKTRKKLIEVALPLEAINKASAREKSIRHGNPSTMHIWWARRPLAAARAVIFAQMVDDPSGYIDVLRSDPKRLQKATSVLKARKKMWDEAQGLAKLAAHSGISAPAPGLEPSLNEILAELERDRLFRIIEDLVQWENTTNESVLKQAREEILQSWRRSCADNADHPRAKELFDRYKLPAFHDPFAGGGSLPLEAQRLGLESYASDLNPVAVLINKAMIEIPPKFAGKPPVNPEAKGDKGLFAREWMGAKGLAEDVRYYGKWVRDEAEKRIGQLYPKVEITAEMVKERPDLKEYKGKKLTVIAWIWARTVKSPNPAFANVDVPLVSTFMLSIKPGKEAYVEPVIDSGDYHFTVKVGKPKNIETVKYGTKLARANFICLMSKSPIMSDYVKMECKSGRMGERLMAMVVAGDRNKIFLPPTEAMEAVAHKAKPEWKPDVKISGSTQYINVKPYGMEYFSQVFTNRQLVALLTFSDLVIEVLDQVKRDALSIGMTDDKPLANGGIGAKAYADALGVYLSLCVGRSANYWSSLTAWGGDFVVQTFGRQALPMTWDHAEVNPLSNSTGNWTGALEWISRVIDSALPATIGGYATQCDAQNQLISKGKFVSTDPPYYDNVPYADLSDFFYIWLRRSVRNIFPELFTTLSTPKNEELVAFAYRHANGKTGAEAFFLNGMTQALTQIAQQTHPAFPITIYYAFKQTEKEDEDGTTSTGWETFLDAAITAGLSVTGTWPIRTERSGGFRNLSRNSLASSIVLVCHQRVAGLSSATRREFMTTLKAELPLALVHLQRGNIAPVDLAQAAIGPGMAIYTRYNNVIDAEGKPLSVREALALINQALDEVLAEQEGDFDADTRWALAWFEQSGFTEGEFGVAETLSIAKNTSVSGLADAGILVSSRGKVLLLKPSELSKDWDPGTDSRLTVWEMVHHLIRVLESGGEPEAAKLLAKLGSKAETARELCYRLYIISERKKRAAEALSYNALVQSWPEITRLAQEGGKLSGKERTLIDEMEQE